LININFSGLTGQALEIEDKDIPSLKEFQDVIPDHYFKCNTKTSLGYLLQSALIQSLVITIGLYIPLTTKMIPIWIIYALISGTTAMGFWVIAHECGHGAFSKNKTLESITGYLLHSLLLVPYFSWQRSHAVHHRFTNNITNGETHVPLVIKGNGVTEKVGGEKELNFSNSLKTLSISLLKIINDIRFLASGPRSGLGELTIPANEPGSSIMPGKVNPTQIEALSMVCVQVIGNSTTVDLAGSNGHFQLNTYKPVIAFNIIQSLNLLSDGIKSFNNNCLKGLKANKEIIDNHLNNSLMLVTALNKSIGYDNAAKIAKKAFSENLTFKEAALKLKLISEKDFDKIVDPKKMI